MVLCHEYVKIQEDSVMNKETRPAVVPVYKQAS